MILTVVILSFRKEQIQTLKILLFVKKSDGEGTDFYYMGRVHPIAWEQKEIYNDKGIALPIMNFRLKLEHSVREDIYQYFVCT